MNSVIDAIGPVWTVRILTAFNFLVNVFQVIASTSIRIVTAIINFLNGTSDRWVFLRGGIGPIPATMVRNYMTSPIVSWVYDSQSNTLYYMNREDPGVPVERTLPVLSLAVTTPTRTYSADEFNAMFSYSAPRGVSPNPRLLLYCWSVQNSVWFAPNVETGESPVLTIIDQNGESIEQPVFFRSDEDITRWDALFREDIDDEDEGETGSDSGSESDAEADEDGTDGDDEGSEGDVESEEEEDDRGDGAEGEEEGEVETEEELGNSGDGTDTSGDIDEENSGDGADMDAEGDNATPTVATELSDA